jgi:hypothetical protein
MIQIKRQNLEQLAQEYFDVLNPVTKKKEYNKNEALIYFLKTEIDVSDGDLKLFYEYILDETNKYTLLKSIITSKPQDLWENIIGKEVGGKYLSLTEIDRESVKKFFKKKYENLRENPKGYWLASHLNVKVCSYCNREYTFHYLTEDKEPKILYDFDHFFNKGTYPYLALSFYNLVPSCSICNSRFKHSEKFTLTKNFHPYLSGFEKEVVFRVKLKTKGEIKKYLKEQKIEATDEEVNKHFGVAFFRGDLESFEIELKEAANLNIEEKEIAKKALPCKEENKCKEKDKKEGKGNIDVFQLKKVYNQHKDIALELIQKSQTYNESYIDELFRKYEGTLFRSREDVLRLALGNFVETEDFEKHPLSKLTHDIAQELGLL